MDAGRRRIAEHGLGSAEVIIFFKNSEAGLLVRRVLISACVMAVALGPSLFSGKSFAMDIKVDGNQVSMSGPVRGDECDTLGSIIRKQSIKQVIFHNSKGGDANAGYCVGALILEHGIATSIQGSCASSCSRMWLGGATRKLDGPNSRVGLHGNYDKRGALQSGAPDRLRDWITTYVPSVDRKLLEEWIHLPINRQMMYFYNAKAELCNRGNCADVKGRNARNAGLLK